MIISTNPLTSVRKECVYEMCILNYVRNKKNEWKNIISCQNMSDSTFRAIKSIGSLILSQAFARRTIRLY